MKKMIGLVVLLCLACHISFAQSNASFKPEIDAFLKKDQVKMPPENAILFVGSSSIKKWTDLAEYFPKYTVINRGFGGSQLPNLIYYADKIIYPYHPKQVIIYCGENNFDYDREVSADTVFARFKTLFEQIRTHLPDANIGFISIKLSPSRKFAWDKIRVTNQKVKEFIMGQSQASYIDITKDMFDANGKAITSIYQSDLLHLKPAGYKIWQKNIQHYLVD